MQPSPIRNPMDLEQLFAEIAAEYGLDKHMLAELAWRESRWDPLAIGKANDMGIMQIVPRTWDKWSKIVGVYDPFDPESNIRVGAAFLAGLREMLKKDLNLSGEHWMLLAYNWGPINVRNHVQAGKKWEDAPEKRREYVLDILLGAEARALAAAEPISNRK